MSTSSKSFNRLSTPLYSQIFSDWRDLKMMDVVKMAQGAAVSHSTLAERTRTMFITKLPQYFDHYVIEKKNIIKDKEWTAFDYALDRFVAKDLARDPQQKEEWLRRIYEITTCSRRKFSRGLQPILVSRAEESSVQEEKKEMNLFEQDSEEMGHFFDSEKVLIPLACLPGKVFASTLNNGNFRESMTQEISFANLTSEAYQIVIAFLKRDPTQPISTTVRPTLATVGQIFKFAHQYELENLQNICLQTLVELLYNREIKANANWDEIREQIKKDLLNEHEIAKTIEKYWIALYEIGSILECATGLSGRENMILNIFRELEFSRYSTICPHRTFNVDLGKLFQYYNTNSPKMSPDKQDWIYRRLVGCLNWGNNLEILNYLKAYKDDNKQLQDLVKGFLQHRYRR